MSRGRFVALEGGDGTGKSTQAGRLADALDALLTREPGGTALGEGIRHLVLDPAGPTIGRRAEALLMAAARAQHVEEVIEPALAAGRDVVTDRFIGSSVAYQGHGRELDPGEVHELSRWATVGLEPDLTVLLEVSEAVAAERLGLDLDRLESAGDAFHRRVAAGYLAQAAADPDRWVTVDASGSVDDVAAAVRAAVEARLPSC